MRDAPTGRDEACWRSKIATHQLLPHTVTTTLRHSSAASTWLLLVAVRKDENRVRSPSPQKKISNAHCTSSGTAAPRLHPNLTAPWQPPQQSLSHLLPHKTIQWRPGRCTARSHQPEERARSHPAGTAGAFSPAGRRPRVLSACDMLQQAGMVQQTCNRLLHAATGRHAARNWHAA